jgi:hypothetical protein
MCELYFGLLMSMPPTSGSTARPAYRILSSISWCFLLLILLILLYLYSVCLISLSLSLTESAVSLLSDFDLFPVGFGLLYACFTLLFSDLSVALAPYLFTVCLLSLALTSF